MPSTEIWYCCQCGFGPCNSAIDYFCPDCATQRCTECNTSRITLEPSVVKTSDQNIETSDQIIKISDQNVNIPDQNAEISDQRSVSPSGEMRQAANELAIILMEDRELEKLFIAAMNDKRISPDRFVRNFKRLLKLFAQDLKEEMREVADLELARFVSSKAGLVAAVVRQKLEPRRGNVKEPQIEDDPLDKEIMDVSTDDEAPEEEAKNHHFAALAAHGRTFIEESAAFRELRKNFGNFLNSQLEQNIRHESTIESETQSKTSSNMSPTGLFQKFQRNVWAPLSCITLRESHIPTGHQRVRWINRRGKKLYDDYIELEPGALQALQEYLNSPVYRTRPAHESEQGHTSSHSIPLHTTNLASTRNPDSTAISGQRYVAPGQVIRSNQVREDIELGEVSARSFHLLLCMENGRHGVQLHQELVTHIIDDRQLFHTLRSVYHSHRGRFKPYLSLRTVCRIDFMKFVYGGHKYIDVRCHDVICEHGKPCNCIPPADLVPPKGQEYEYRPIPSKLSPPIGPRLMMDFFIDPENINPNCTLVIEQLPKRTCGELRSPSFELREAWGIYFKEDWDWVRIWWILALGFFPPSLLFGILWGILKGDIQGAFGVASWWMAGATILIGIVGTCTWTN